MPSLNLALMKLNARTRFQQFRVTLPSAVQARTLDPATILGNPLLAPTPLSVASSPLVRPQLPLSGPTIGGHRAVTAIPTPVPPGLVQAASNDKRDVDLQTSANNEYGAFIDQMSQAIVQAVDLWRQTVYLEGVVINGVTATGGALKGPALADLLTPHAPRVGLFGKAQTHATALVNAIGQGWHQAVGMVTVPGMPWYPTFAVFPGPMVPPTPNVPFPLVSLRFSLAFLNSNLLKTQALQRIQGGAVFAADELFTAICVGLESALEVWIPAQMVTNVLGTGPVPTFAPPYVPVGPVVGGYVLPNPGILAT